MTIHPGNHLMPILIFVIFRTIIHSLHSKYMLFIFGVNYCHIRYTVSESVLITFIHSYDIYLNISYIHRQYHVSTISYYLIW